MKIHVNQILKPWYFAGFSTFLCLLMVVLFFFQRIDYNKKISETTYYYDKLKEDIIVTERDRMLKTMSMYDLIISTYGQKHHKKYDVGKKRKYQGLSKWQKPLFNRKCYEYERLLDIPHMTFHTTAKIETAFNPLAETRYEDGSLKEAGIFQNRQGAVGQALIFLKEMYAINPNMAQNFEFEFKDMSSLFNPLNALKVEALLYWGYKRRYAGQQAWYVTVIHWGESRIAPYYYQRRNDGILPENFTFNKNTIKEDVRDPLQYWGLWYANWSQFSRFKIEVGIETWYDKIYREECSRLEWQFIQSWKYIRQLKEGVEELKQFQLEAKQEHEKRLNHILKKAKDVDEKYAQLHGLIKKGKFKHINDILKLWKGHFKELILDLSAESKARFNRIAIITYLSIMGIIVIFSIIGFFVVFLKIIIKVKKHIKKKKKINQYMENLMQ